MVRVFCIGTIGFLSIYLAQPGEVMAQSSGIWAKISARIIGGSTRFDGYVNFSAISRRGKVTGKLNNGSKCRGKAKINILFSRGSGTLRCDNGLSGKYAFTLSSRFPIRGQGRGALKDGRKVTLKISPAN